MRKLPLQALFFDFDGVLVDSNSTKTGAFRTLFAGYDKKSVAAIVAYHKQHGGISRVEKIEYAHRHILKQPLSDAELVHWTTAYSELVVNRVIDAPWIDGAQEFLDSIQGALPIFVISGTPEDELRYIIERRNMTGYFHKILGSPIRKPEHIRNLLVSCKLVPERCVFIGDALTDYNAAKVAGLQFIGIQGEVSFPDGATILPDCRGLRGAIAAHFVWDPVG